MLENFLDLLLGNVFYLDRMGCLVIDKNKNKIELTVIFVVM